MIGAPLRLKPNPASGTAGPPFVGPTTAPPHAGEIASPIDLCGTPGGIQIGVHTARQLWVIPIAAPLKDIAVHVVQAPGVGRITADRRGPLQRGPGLSAAVRLTL